MRQTQIQANLPPTQLPGNLLNPALSSSSSVPLPIANFPAGLAHDARNMLAAMDIYCELLSGPGVLNPQYRHLIDELRLLRESSSGLIDRLLVQCIALPGGEQREPGYNGSVSNTRAEKEAGLLEPRTSDAASPRKPVVSVASELLATHKMLSALAGPKVLVETATAEAPEGELRIAAVDFTRVLINLVRNAAEAMGTGGRIMIAAKLAPEDPSMGRAMLISVEDNGPGITLSLLERIFDLNTAGEPGGEQTRRRMSFRPRGLGLRIVRELVEGGGGIIRAARLPERGSRFEIVLPMVTKYTGQ